MFNNEKLDNIPEQDQHKSVQNIFDVTNVSDLNPDTRKRVQNLHLSDNTKNVFNLFDRKNNLTISEVIVAMERLHDEIKTRSWVSVSLTKLCKRGLIKRIRKGQYEKI